MKIITSYTTDFISPATATGHTGAGAGTGAYYITCIVTGFCLQAAGIPSLWALAESGT